MKRIGLALLLLLFAGLLCFGGAAAEKTVYVSSKGVDSAGGESPTSPVRTLVRAIAALEVAGADTGKIVLTD
ncbi:MAG: hypothetical protein IJU41_07520, partial [Clostridia bacterium]|nr:hypothetical protein [Clostridia bacterium]